MTNPVTNNFGINTDVFTSTPEDIKQFTTGEFSDVIISINKLKSSTSSRGETYNVFLIEVTKLGYETLSYIVVPEFTKDQSRINTVLLTMLDKGIKFAKMQLPSVSIVEGESTKEDTSPLIVSNFKTQS